ncbi:DUF3693 domain-containing protein [Xylella fastidiosa]|uniref:DUF3693 domain-containing protein n=1 Tax=Xylella fastidiosa TaxID=2371 RepID=UPI001F3064E2|nr:DUF3693 domain-containing protein [Xylella fastidiosa]UIT53088.1 DUF3693 domain-containing protein [Xylella fastidiosa subsp. fastidiosa]
MHTEKLIKLCVQQALRNSVRGLAEELGLNSVSINDWKLGYKPIPEERIRQLAKFAGEDPGHWLLLIKSEQEKGDLGKEWAKLYKKLTATAATLLIGAGITCPNPSQAQSISEKFTNESSHNAYYVHQVGAYKARCLASPKNGV